MDFASADTPARWIRARRFRVTHVDLAVRVDLTAHQVQGSVTHTVAFFPHAERRTIELDAADLTISQVHINGEDAIYSIHGERLSIATPTTIGETCQVRINFTATNPLKGLYFVDANAQRGEVAMAWTQGAMEDHHFWFPCFDDPNNQSTYRIALTHRESYMALANGDQVSSTVSEPGWKTTVFEQKKPHVLYLLNVVVGDLTACVDKPVTIGDRSIPVAHYLPRGREAAVGVFRATGFAISWLSEMTGVPYPWTRYGHVVVHRFLWGGMENTTLTTITDRVLIDDATRELEDVDADFLVIHELVHQWFGDLLTMKAWSDIWLNESFATWLECRGTAAWRAQRAQPSDGSANEQDIRQLLLWENKESYLAQESGRYQRPLVTNRYDDAYELFDRVAYEKGSLVLEHLSAILGEARMRAALALYTNRHAGDLVESADFRQAVEDATGEPLDWFFSQWLDRSGHPKLKVASTHDAGRGQLTITVAQELATGTNPWRVPTAVAWCENGQVHRQEIELQRAHDVWVVPCAQAPTWVCVDPDGHVPAEWDEPGDEASLLARISAAEISASARARAAVAAGQRYATARLRAGLRAAVVAAEQPELVRRQAIQALGALRDSAAVTDLCDVASVTLPPRLRRAVAEAVAAGAAGRADAELAHRVETFAADEVSVLTAAEWWATRGALRVAGATPVLRARLHRPSWNDRLRIACLRGLGASREAAAIDEVLPLVAQLELPDPTRAAACAAAAQLGGLHSMARPRIRLALEAQLEDASMVVRSAAGKALGVLGDPAASSVISARRAREPFGNVRRVFREAVDVLHRSAAATETQAELRKRCDELQHEQKDLKKRLEAMEKRLG